MSYKIDVSAADVTWQILMLQEFPQIANKHFYPAMHRSTSAIKAAIEPKIPSSRARAEFRKAVSGNGLNITGRVGWWGGIESWFINVLEYGAKPHKQGYIPFLGVTIKMHPGVAAGKFMERGRLEAQDITDAEMIMAADGVVNDLAKKG